MHVRPELTDFRHLYRSPKWRYCVDCHEWFHPDEYVTHAHIYFENIESGERLIYHDSPKKTPDREG